MKKIAIVVLFILLASAMQAEAYESRKVVNTKLIESEYNLFGTPLPFGDRLYLVTYEGGQQQYVVTHGMSIGKATIVESTSTVWCTAGKTCDITFRAKAPNLPRFVANGFATHKFELYDDSGSYPFVVATRTPNPLIDSQVPASYGKLEMFTLPDSYLAGKKYMFIKEYVQDRTTGQWIAGYDSGSSELRLDVVYTESVQATPAPTQTSSASLKIESSPQGVAVTASGAYLGTTPFTLALQAGESMIIKFDLAGYVTQYKGVSSSSSNPFLVVMVPVNTGDAGGCPQVVTTAYDPTTLKTEKFPTPCDIPSGWVVGTPKPTPQNGYIKVISNVPANVKIDGKPAGTTEQTFFTTTVGEHDVELFQSGYTTFTTQVTVDYGATEEVTASLTAITPQKTTPAQTSTTATSTATPAGTSAIQKEQAGAMLYKGVDITVGTDGYYYVGDIPHDSLAEAKKTIDEQIASKSEPKSPGFEAVFAIAGLFAVAYLVLRQEPKER